MSYLQGHHGQNRYLGGKGLGGGNAYLGTGMCVDAGIGFARDA